MSRVRNMNVASGRVRDLFNNQQRGRSNNTARDVRDEDNFETQARGNQTSDPRINAAPAAAVQAAQRQALEAQSRAANQEPQAVTQIQEPQATATNPESQAARATTTSEAPSPNDSQAAPESQSSANAQSQSSTTNVRASEQEFLQDLRDKVNQEQEAERALRPNPHLNLERIEAANPSDEELKNLVTMQAQQNKNRRLDSLNEQHRTAMQNYDEHRESLSQQIQQLREDVDSDSIRRGLGRSSIATGRQDQVNISGLEAMSRLERDITEMVNTFNQNVANLEFDKAFEIEQNLFNKIRERDRLLSEAIRYNNTLIVQENNNLRDVYRFNNEFGHNIENAINSRDQRMQMALDFYRGLERDVALEMLDSSRGNLIQYLGEDNFNLLRREIQGGFFNRLRNHFGW